MDKAICHHLVAACILSDIPLNGLKKISRSLRTIRRKLHAKKANGTISDDELDKITEDEPIPDNTIHNSMTQPIDMVDNDATNEAPEAPILSPKRKRGRPRKADKALVYEDAPTRNSVARPARSCKKT